MINADKTQIANVFYVSDLDRTLGFYRDVLGVDISPQDDGPHAGFAMHQIGGVWFIFFQQSAAEPPGKSPVVVFGLEDGIQDAVEALARQGVEIVAPVSEAPGGLSADFLDPDGHVLGFYQAVTD